MEIFITATFDAQINIAGSQTILLRDETARLLPDNSRKTLISVLPINESGDNYLLPYCLSFNLDNQTLCESEFCDVRLVDNVCNVRLLPKVLSRTQLFTTISIGNKKYTLMQNAFDHTISIKGQSQSYDLSVNFGVHNFNYYTKTFGNTSYVFLEFAGRNNAYLVFGRDILSPIFEGKVDSYEWKDNTIIIGQKYDGELGQIRLTHYQFDTECRQTLQEVGYLKDKPPLRPIPSLVPYLFMECVLAGNVTLAKELCTHDFGALISAQNLKEFFVPFDQFGQYKGGSANTLCLIKKGHLVGVLNFEVVNGKIDNIKSF